MLDEVLAEYFEWIDCRLAQADVPLALRPYQAATFFVREYVSDFEGGSKEQLFGAIVDRTENWYVDRYGSQHLKSKFDSALGMVELLGTAFELRIPITVMRQEPNSDIRALHFPIDLLDGEVPTEWFKAGPNLDHLSSEKCDRLKKDAVQVATLTRRICINLNFGVIENSEGQGLLPSIRMSLDRAVAGTCSGQPAQRSMAIWDIHFAVEMAVKAFIYSRGESPGLIHSLEDLFKVAARLGLRDPSHALLRVLPCTKVVIDARYGKGPIPSLAQVMEIYVESLKVLLICAESLTRDISFDSPGLVIYLQHK